MESKTLKYSPKVVSIFSGCGGLDLGFHLEGYDTIWANDFAEWAVKSFEGYFGKVIHYGDITQINPYTDKAYLNAIWFSADSRVKIFLSSGNSLDLMVQEAVCSVTLQSLSMLRNLKHLFLKTSRAY